MIQKAESLRASQARVLAMFALYGDMNDQQLVEYLHDAERTAGLPEMSQSGIRSRRSELSKPNMERLDAIVVELWERSGVRSSKARTASFADSVPAIQEEARAHLRIEGFKSKLWDTGRREVVNGRRVVIWGLAR